jgi:hypothetical protein
MMTSYRGQLIEADWLHRRVISVYEYVDEDMSTPYGGPRWNMRLDMGPDVVSWMSFAKWEIKHIPQAGEVYSELRTEEGPILVATLGEETLYDHRDEEARP